MAIVQSSMTEEILSRQERAVIRGIYRASQLAEAKLALDKAFSSYESFGATQKVEIPAQLVEQKKQIDAYLANAIRSALVSTKVPASSPTVKDDLSVKV